MILNKFELTAADIKTLLKKKTPLVWVLSHGQVFANPAAVQESLTKTLQRLLDANVAVAMGSDDSQRTLRMELNYWFGLSENWTMQHTPKVLCENTPRAIFPNRKIWQN
ncbi:MAG: hypothetical protein IPH31_04815 [Lewinellaceae bacterium]|nr:hypothetical protein [Lewinellaceae bacterium]